MHYKQRAYLCEWITHSLHHAIKIFNFSLTPPTPSRFPSAWKVREAAKSNGKIWWDESVAHTLIHSRSLIRRIHIEKLNKIILATLHTLTFILNIVKYCVKGFSSPSHNNGEGSHEKRLAKIFQRARFVWEPTRSLWRENWDINRRDGHRRDGHSVCPLCESRSWGRVSHELEIVCVWVSRINHGHMERLRSQTPTAARLPSFICKLSPDQVKRSHGPSWKKKGHYLCIRR